MKIGNIVVTMHNVYHQTTTVMGGRTVWMVPMKATASRVSSLVLIRRVCRGGAAVRPPKKQI